MNLKDKVTIATPIRITNERDWHYFEECMKTFYATLEDRPEHIIWASIDEPWKDRYNKLIEQLHVNLTVVDPNASSCEGFYKAVDIAKTPYIYPLLGDIITVTKKNFLAPCVEAMDREEKLSQVRFSGWPMATNKGNTVCLVTDGKDVFFEEVPGTPLRKMNVGEDVIWIHQMTINNLKPVLAFNTWLSLLRKDFTSRVLKGVRQHLPHNNSIKTSLNVLCDTASLSLRKDITPNPGWRKGLEFIEGYTEGFLNLACYTFPHGTELVNMDKFRKCHTIEIKSAKDRSLRWKNANK